MKHFQQHTWLPVRGVGEAVDEHGHIPILEAVLHDALVQCHAPRAYLCSSVGKLAFSLVISARFEVRCVIMI